MNLLDGYQIYKDIQRKGLGVILEYFFISKYNPLK